LIIKQLSFSQNALKLTCSNVEFQKFPGVIPPDPRFKGRGGEGREGEGREWEGKGGEGREGWGGGWKGLGG
jgi:hypothetical protein